ncbi:M48 family metallopeptidase [Pelomonas sp. CA6]|uniref:M48 family metallopeptidase n=1 Tax=Pelomonas sp. CA6 TaxID=2907999 RepID=UPI001F4B0A0B|nr:M48 family metallopeptidase [Pelomonas sp. CA6]MCH7342578.1 M48 family metallopeptidase [Pelomonas sp. CA6]
MQSQNLVYPRERTLGVIALVLGLLIWLALIVGTLGVILVVLLSLSLVYLFAQSAFISYIKGSGVQLSESQYPDLYRRYRDCCERLEVRDEPSVYLLQGGGWLNAFATRFLGRDFVVLLSDVVDAMDEHPDGVSFYIGHELAHIRLGHLGFGSLVRAPALWFPLLGAAYSRAKESSCDLHGRACCSSDENAARALAALAVGGKRWQTLNLEKYDSQLQDTRGFWMSLHELCSGYPWLSKRIARVQGRGVPSRHGVAWLLALFVPYGGGGAIAAALPLMLVALVGVGAAVGLPAYRDYQQRAQFASDLVAAQALQQRFADHYLENESIPTLADVGVNELLPTGATLSVNEDNMVLTVQREAGGFELTPSVNDSGKIEWSCGPMEGTRAKLLPASCQ